MRSLALLLAMALGATGCSNFIRLDRDLRLSERSCSVRGQATPFVPDQGHVYVAVFRLHDGIVQIVDVVRLAPRPGRFAFVLPLDDDYMLVAFQDLNENQRRDPTEPVWVYGDPSPVPLDENRISAWIDVRLAKELPPTVKPELVAAFAQARGNKSLVDLETGHDIFVAHGEIANLDAPRFSAEAGSSGLWEPLVFLKANGTGVYFLEDFDPKRQPVLFVYGASGSPQDFRYFFEHLDRKRYQAWFFLYPSGMRLATASNVLLGVIDDLAERYAFEDLEVVAHSMGGLVARSFVLKDIAHHGHVKTFVTLSSPWGGVTAAALGVERSPLVVPSWRDVAAGSEFTKKLFEQSLSPEVPHCLGFTFRGRRRPGLPTSNDTVVSVESELYPDAQADAVFLRGFDDTHVGVLRTQQALDFVESCLAQRERGAAR